MSIDRCDRVAYLQLVDGNPRVGRKSLKHRNQELETSAPVTNKEHHADQIENLKVLVDCDQWRRGKLFFIFICGNLAEALTFINTEAMFRNCKKDNDLEELDVSMRERKFVCLLVKDRQ